MPRHLSHVTVGQLPTFTIYIYYYITWVSNYSFVMMWDVGAVYCAVSLLQMSAGERKLLIKPPADSIAN